MRAFSIRVISNIFKQIFSLFVCLLFIESAQSYEHNLLSSEALYNKSEEVVIVKIIKGEVVGENETYLGKVIVSFKGKNKTEIVFETTPWIVALSPNKIGQYYLLHLQKLNSQYSYVNSLNSVIEIEKLDKNRPDIDLILENRDLRKQYLVSKQDYYYYPSQCTEISKVLCENMVNVLRDLPEEEFKDIWLPKP